jgi:hypothetical protein
MEPLNDKELNDLLRQWRAPQAPASLAGKVLPKRSWRSWLLTGSIRIPVPVALVAAMAALVWVLIVNRPATPADVTVSLSDFQPVPQLEPRIIRSAYEESR